MSWSTILDGRGFLNSNQARGLARESDTFFSILSPELTKIKETLRNKKVDRFLNGKQSLLSIDNDTNCRLAIANLAQIYGQFFTKLDHSYLLRGTLELVKTRVNHPRFGEGLDLFTITNPFSNETPVFLYFKHSKIKRAGLFGEVSVKTLYRNEQNRIEAMGEDFFEEDVQFQIPLILQDITDFDEVFTKKLYLEGNITSIKIGNSKEITSLQKLWIPSVSGSSVSGHVEGVNAYSLVSTHDSGAQLKEQMNNLIKHFQPLINHGNHKFNLVDFDICKESQLPAVTDETQRSILQTHYQKGYRATVGTIITNRGDREIKTCISKMLKSQNTDYTTILDGMSVPRNLMNLLSREKLLTGNLRYHLLTLKVLPISYNVSDVTNYSPQNLRMALSFAKLVPYLLDPQDDEVIVPKQLQDMHLRAVELFKKHNSDEVEDYREDNGLLN